MVTLTDVKHVTRAEQKELERLSPFELKDRLIALAKESERTSARQLLNAGRGNPNWIAATPRAAFFVLGQFGLEEARRIWNEGDLAGMPVQDGIDRRFDAFLARQHDGPGVRFLRAAVAYGVDRLGFERGAWLHELADSAIGDQYPTPDRMLKHTERVVHAYLVQELCAGKPPGGKYDLFAVEGGTAAMCYIFDSLVINRLLHPGDKIALGLPVFTPYIEIPTIERYAFETVHVNASERREDGSHTWQYPDTEIDKLADPSVKAFFLVNPSNPPSVAMRRASMDRLVEVVREKNPNLVVITDDVYGTFIEGFRSLMAELPRNTIGVYSFSKYFGCTGWRLGVVAAHEDNIFDEMIAHLPSADRAALDKRYSTLTLAPERMKFIDRMVADSRQVALNHTAGLSLPQQAQMALFALFALTDAKNEYKALTRHIIERRLKALWDGMGLPIPPDPLRAGYYATLDVMVWAESQFGKDFVDFLVANYEPIDFLIRLAEKFSIVLLNGSGFDAPPWSLRVSLANLPDEAYGKIGQQLRAVATEYIEAWQASRN